MMIKLITFSKTDYNLIRYGLNNGHLGLIRDKLKKNLITVQLVCNTHSVYVFFYKLANTRMSTLRFIR